jgi:hypothetical protein
MGVDAIIKVAGDSDGDEVDCNGAVLSQNMRDDDCGDVKCLAFTL